MMKNANGTSHVALTNCLETLTTVMIAIANREVSAKAEAEITTLVKAIQLVRAELANVPAPVFIDMVDPRVK